MWVPEEEYEKIERMIPIPCVNAIIKNTNNEYLLAKRNNHPVKGKYWVIGGGIRKGEEIIEALKREIKEETGIKWKSIMEYRLLSVSSSLFRSRHCIELNFLVLVDKTVKIKLNKEHSSFKWVNRSSLGTPEDYLKNGLILDLDFRGKEGRE